MKRVDQLRLICNPVRIAGENNHNHLAVVLLKSLNEGALQEKRTYPGIRKPRENLRVWRGIRHGY